RPQHGHDGAHGFVHVADVLQHGKRVDEVEDAGAEAAGRILEEALVDAEGVEAIHALRQPGVRARDLDAVDRASGMAGGDRERHATLAAPGIEDAPGVGADDLLLERPELRVALHTLHGLAGLDAEQDAEPDLQALEPETAARARVVALV